MLGLKTEIRSCGVVDLMLQKAQPSGLRCAQRPQALGIGCASCCGKAGCCRSSSNAFQWGVVVYKATRCAGFVPLCLMIYCFLGISVLCRYNCERATHNVHCRCPANLCCIVSCTRWSCLLKCTGALVACCWTSGPGRGMHPTCDCTRKAGLLNEMPVPPERWSPRPLCRQQA